MKEKDNSIIIPLKNINENEDDYHNFFNPKSHEKVYTKKVRNVVNNKIRKSKLVMKKIKIQSKSIQNSPDMKTNIYKDNLLNLEMIPSDIYSDMANSIKTLHVRQMYGEAIKVKEIANKKDGYLLYIKPLSMLDQSVTLNNNKNVHKSKKSISMDLKEFNPEKYNMLSQRKTLAVFNFNEVTRLKGELSKENINIPMNTLRKAFLSPETTVYPKHFLPNPGFGLLLNPYVENKRKKVK